MKIAIASNHTGFKTKSSILEQLRELGHDAIDFGPPNGDLCDYPDYAAEASQAVSCGQVERAILISGTGIGMSIVANKFPGVRAALCHDDLTAEMSRRQNDANILCLSVNLLGDELSSRIIEVWLQTQFEGGRHARRVAKIVELEQRVEGRPINRSAHRTPVSA